MKILLLLKEITNKIDATYDNYRDKCKIYYKFSRRDER